MEAASNSTLHSLRFSRTLKPETPKIFLRFNLLFSSSPRSLTFPCKSSRFPRFASWSLPSERVGPASQQLALLLEVEGKAGGDEERMLTLFFNQIGWPTSLPTTEKENFMKSVLQEMREALDEYVTTKSFAFTTWS